jgi:competence protein ComEC
MPLLWVSLLFISGIFVGSLLSLPATFWLTLSAATLLLVFAFRRVPQFSEIKFPPLLIACTLALFLGAWRYQFAQPDITPKHIAFYNDRDYDVLVTGFVSDLPDYRDTYTNLRLGVQAADTGDGDFPAGGLILARVPPNQEYHYGQTLRLRGKLKTPPEDEEFSYRDYLAGKNIYSYMSIAEATHLPEEGGNFILKAVYAFKEKSLVNIYKIFPDPEASLLAGILLGVDSGLPKDIQQAFKNTGTSHIIAISGFNIAIIAGIFTALFSRWFGPRRGAAAAVIFIFLYAFLVGAEASVVRAAIMGSFGLFARQVGRRQTAINTLLAVAALMCIWNPLYVWDVGFQLSFFATLGLILYSEPFSGFSLRIIGRFTSPDSAQRINAPFSDFVLLTLAAQLTTLPIMAYHFKQISLVSIIANPFILPVQPAVMILAGLALLLSYVWIPLGQLAAWIAWPFAVYTIRAVEFFNWPSWILYLGDSSIWFVVFFYAALLSVTFGLPRIKDILASVSERVKNIPSILILTALAIATFLVWRAAFSASDGKLHITFLDVGSADAVLIQTPSGHHVLVNGGTSPSLLSNELGRRLPFSRKLDWLVIASTDENQVAALPRVLDRYPPQNVLWSGNTQASFSARQVEIWLTDNGIPVTHAETGQRLDLGDGAFIEVQAAGPRGSVLVIQWNNFRALLPIGIDADSLGAKFDPVDILLLADSGYAASNPKEWIVGLNPQLIVLSVGAGDPDGLPSSATLDAAGGYSLLRTDRNGWITVTTDGNEMQVEVERKETATAIPTGNALQVEPKETETSMPGLNP